MFVLLSSEPRRVPAAFLRWPFIGVLWAGFLTAVLSEETPWRWYWSNPRPHGNNIAGFAHHPDHSVIQVTGQGQVYGRNALGDWDPRESGTRKDLRGAAFFGNRLLVSGEEGLILWSEDAQRFQQLQLDTTDWLEGVAASDAIAVAVGDHAAIFRSEDGTNWVRQQVGFTNWLRGVAWGGGVFAAVGDAGLIVTSEDGTEWTLRETADGNGADLNGIAWTGNGFVVAGDRVNGGGTAIFGNASGTSWVRQTQSGATGNLLAAASASPSSRLVAGEQEVRLASGSAVILWSDQTAPPGGAPVRTYDAAIASDRTYLLGGRTGLLVDGVQVSPDPGQTEWVPYPSPPRNWLFDIVPHDVVSTNVTARLLDDRPVYSATVVTNQFYVAAGDLGTLLTSESGVHWSQMPNPTNAAEQVYLALAASRPGLVAVGSEGLISFSPDTYLELVTTNEFVREDGTPIEVTVTNEVSTLGIVWHEVPPPTELDLLAACADSRRFVIAGQSGYVASSTDGTNWIAGLSGTSLAISGLAAWQDGYVAVGEDGLVLTSPDAVAWTPRISGTTNWLFRVRSAPGQLVAVGRGGTLLTSPDGIAWTLRDSGVTNGLNDAVFTIRGWFVAGNQGTLIHSRDGEAWTLDSDLITGKSLYGLSKRGIQLIAIGIEGIILRTRLTPYLNPIQFAEYPQEPGDRVFVFRGELDQRFSLDRGASVNTIRPGPVLTITEPDGFRFYLDPLREDLDAQLFVAPNDP